MDAPWYIHISVGAAYKLGMEGTHIGPVVIGNHFDEGMSKLKWLLP